MAKPARNWKLVNAKLRAERGCRVCGRHPWIRAHVLKRQFDDRSEPLPAASVVPLCVVHDAAYEANDLDLAPYLREDELRWAMLRLGHYSAAVRIRGTRQPTPLIGNTFDP